MKKEIFCNFNDCIKFNIFSADCQIVNYLSSDAPTFERSALDASFIKVNLHDVNMQCCRNYDVYYCD